MLVSRIIAIVMLACLVLGASPALASRTQTTLFEAPRDLLDPATRDGALAQLDSFGIHSLRVVLYWKSVAPAPAARTKPPFDATDPHNYAWGQYDPLLAAAKQRGWSVLLTVSGPVPRWATAGGRDNVTRPEPLEFQRFMTAVGRHYGSEVSTFSIWNEPNHPQFLDPQYINGQPASPRIYRALVQSGVQGLHDAGLTSAPVLMGETAPTGTGHDVAPLVFLRGALCLDNHYRRSRSCSALPVAGYAHHAYTKPAGPSYRPPGRDDVMIGVLSRLSKALDRAARAGALPHNLPIWLTEFGIQSKPNPFLGVPLAQQPEFYAISERIAYRNPRVAVFSQYLLRDDPSIARPGSAAAGTGFIGFQSGLRLANGRVKPAYEAFRLPLAVHKIGHRASLWGLVRPATGPTTVTVMAADRNSHFRKLAVVRTDAQGYWTLRSALRRGRRWQVQWTAPGGTTYQGPPIRAY